jgi:hypothetical protein
MRRWGLLVLGLGVGLIAGCITGKPLTSTSWLRPAPSPARVDGPDVVQMVTAVIEAPAGDAYVNEELWTQTDDQVLSLEQKALLADNGFRIGQVGGVLPAGLQALLTSPRSCRDPRQIQQHAGKPTRLSLGPVLPECRCQVCQGEQKVPVALEQAQCGLVVVPALAADGRIRLRFTPEIQHGHATMAPQPDQDRTLWMLQKQQPVEEYPALSWEVTLSRDEYVLVGGRFDQPETLGHACFVRIAESPPKQRLLVIRTVRVIAGTEAALTTAADESATASRSPPLALQAAWTTVRGQRP